MSVRGERDIERMLRASRPELPAESREEIERRVEAVKARPSGVRALTERLRPRRESERRGLRPRGIAMAVSAAALAVVISPPLISSLQSSPTVGGEISAAELRPAESGGGVAPPVSAGSGAAPEADVMRADGATAEPLPPLAEPPIYPPAGGDLGDLEGPREIERSALIALQVSDAREGASEAVRITGALGGIVLSSQISSGELSEWAQLEIRVPSEKLQSALSRLAEIGDVETLESSEADITSEFNPVREQLRELSASQDSLLRELSKAASASERERLQRQLDELRQQEEALRSQLAALQSRAEYASVSLSLRSGGDDPAPSGDESFSPAQAIRWWGDAAPVVAGVLVLLAVPALLGGAAYWIARLRARRRSDR